MFAVLVKEPFCLTPDQIADLTPYQVRHLFFREDKKQPEALPWFMDSAKTDEKGNFVDKEKELFWKVNREWRNFSEEKVQELWNKHQESKKPKKGKGVKNNGPLKT